MVPVFIGMCLSLSVPDLADTLDNECSWAELWALELHKKVQDILLVRFKLGESQLSWLSGVTHASPSGKRIKHHDHGRRAITHQAGWNSHSKRLDKV